MSGARPYEMTGTFFELCDCYTICPCWVGGPPADGRCTGAFGWAIDDGTIGKLDVAGRRVVSVSFHAGHRDHGGQEVWVFVDEGADDETYDALVDVFTGRSGGPLGELATLMGSLLGHERTPIDLTTSGKYLTLTVGRVVSGDAEILTGPDGGTTELAHGRLSQVLGPEAEVGRSSRLRVELGGQGFNLEVTGRSAMRGAFRYGHDGKTP